MMSDVLDRSVLVLNTSFRAIDVTNVYKATQMVCKEEDDARAFFIDPETYSPYTFDEWVETWDDAIRSAKLSADKALQSSCMTFRIPEIIQLSNYRGDGEGNRNKDPKRPPKFSRRNVNLRDEFTCQYCGKKCYNKGEYNYDHVIPRSRGGGMNWNNIVFSCIPCNSKKGGRTPEEAGMVLRRRPYIPEPGELARKRPYAAKLRRKLKGRALPSWEYFLGELYFEAVLQED
jgi:hypothetical protein